MSEYHIQGSVESNLKACWIPGPGVLILGWMEAFLKHPSWKASYAWGLAIALPGCKGTLGLTQNRTGIQDV